MLWNETNEQTYSNMLADETEALSLCKYGIEYRTNSIAIVGNTKQYTGFIGFADYGANHAAISERVTMITAPTAESDKLKLVFSLK
jgi:hypothetical protein